MIDYRITKQAAIIPSTMASIIWETVWSVVTFVIHLISILINGLRPRAKIVPVTDEILLQSATRIAKRIRSRDIKCITVIEAYISRIQTINPDLNAIVADRFEGALEEARKIDEILDAPELDEMYSEKNAPFLGVPLSVKEAFACIGLPNSSGLMSRKGMISESNAVVVANLKRAGCIVLGSTNTSELCMWYESANHIYGRSNNPYDLRRIVGGSSGGEGCIIGGGGSIIGVGSDIGGSIRMPCFFNGIFGHKPSPGIVSNDGQFPVAREKRLELLATGPMCRYAEDLEPMLRIMAGEESIKELNLEKRVNIKKLRFFSIDEGGEEYLVSRIDPQLRQSQENVIQYFESEYGIEVNRIKPHRFKYSTAIWSAKMSSSDTETFNALLNSSGGAKVKPILELIKSIFRMSNHTIPAIILAIFENVHKMPESTTGRLLRSCEKLRDEICNILGDDGVLFYPSHPKLAQYHNAPLFTPMNFTHTAIFNALGLPVTQVPLGLSKEGVPLGIQVVANKNLDRLTLAVARELEREFGGWRNPHSKD
ncbi:fatty-acid amide hydrolase 2-A-like [Anneissia japonica]|uniref:fatty-acid amide hydrolase 2-A-like n=1 Tax=Anneissia japonica TaxID=1529436 RepID=UPI00142594EE|nr:fatty-acid amide hydrolase 2-A-like [Anneissia japonica]